MWPQHPLFSLASNRLVRNPPLQTARRCSLMHRLSFECGVCEGTGGETRARLVREYINSIEGIWMVCLCDLDSGAVKTAHLQYTDSSLCRNQTEREWEGDVLREFTAVYPHWILSRCPEQYWTLLVLILQKSTHWVNKGKRDSDEGMCASICGCGWVRER